MWEPAFADATEGGTVVRTEECPYWSLITLERDCAHGIPFAITCGIYGAMMHTVFRRAEAEAVATYEAMKVDLERLVHVDKAVLYEELDRFVDRSPP